MPRTHAIEDYRNFGIMAHIDAGKTTTTGKLARVLVADGRRRLHELPQEIHRRHRPHAAEDAQQWCALSLAPRHRPDPRRASPRGDGRRPARGPMPCRNGPCGFGLTRPRESCGFGLTRPRNHAGSAAPASEAAQIAATAARARGPWAGAPLR